MKFISYFLLVGSGLFFIGCQPNPSNTDPKFGFFLQDERDFICTSYNLDHDNQMIYMMLEKERANDDNDKTKSAYLKAMEVKKSSNELCNYIRDLKSDFKTSLTGAPRKIADTLRSSLLRFYDDQSKTNKYFIGDNNDNVTGKAKDLKENLVKFEKEVSVYCSTETLTLSFMRLECMDEPSFSEKGKTCSWEVANFYNAPAVGALARLSAIESEVKSAEGDAIADIYYESLIK